MTKEFLIFTWVGVKSRWEVDVLDQRRDSPLATYASGESWTEMATEDGSEIAFTLEGDHLSYRRSTVERSLSRVPSP